MLRGRKLELKRLTLIPMGYLTNFYTQPIRQICTPLKWQRNFESKKRRYIFDNHHVITFEDIKTFLSMLSTYSEDIFKII